MISIGTGSISKARRQAQLRGRSHVRSQSRDNSPQGVLGTEGPLRQGDTDYQAPEDLSKIPMKIRHRHRGTTWPVKPWQMDRREMPESRNIASRIWRRFPDGELAYDDNMGILERAVQKWNDSSQVPLSEYEKLALCAVFPELSVSDVEKDQVRRHAFLTAQERGELKRRVRELPHEVGTKLGFEPKAS